MNVERDLYQEIEEELRNSTTTGQRSFRTMLLTTLCVLLVGVISIGVWSLISDRDPVSAVAVMINGTPTPTPTNTPTNTPVPTETPIPTATTEPTLAPTELPPTPAPTEPPTPTPEPTREWGVAVAPPLADGVHMTRLTLAELRAPALLGLLATLGHTEDLFSSELDVVRAQTEFYLDDTLINAQLHLEGALPNNPLFLLVGQMAGPAEFSDDGATIPLAVNWAPEPVQVSIPQSLLTTLPNASLVINSWLGQSGWLWIMADSAELETAITNCRNSAPAKSNYFMPEGEWSCADQSRLLTDGGTQFRALVLQGVSADGNTIEPLMARPVNPISNRWIYADFGPFGMPLVVSADVASQASSSGMLSGLVRGSWNGSNFDADMLLQPRFADGTYLYEFLWSQESTEP